MLYPSFLNKNDKIGVVGLSAGVSLDDSLFDVSINNIRSYGYNVIISDNVKVNNEVTSNRIEELNHFISDSSIKMIMVSCGGDFLYEIIPNVDYNLIKNNVKWYMGASDPTSLLYTITTMLDISTIYGFNACSFDSKIMHESQKISLNMISGNIIRQNSYELYESDKNSRIDGNYNLDKEDYWESNMDVDITGRIIGGCIDCIRYLPGTKYDNTINFIEKYKDDGIIWYFDVFSMTSEDFYLTLLQFKNMGWFKYTKGVIVGRVMFPTTFTSVDYKKALDKVFDCPYIYNADIGHVAPKITIINGSIAHIKCSNGKGYIEQELI